MHYGTLKMRKVLPFCVSSFHPIFWLKSLPLCIYRWEKVEKVNPILALCIYGPLGKLVNLAQFVTILEPVSPFFGPIRVWIAPNLEKWDRVLPYCTSGGLWGPFWAISGHLGLILGPRARGWGLCWSLFLTHLASKNDLNGSILSHWGIYSITILYWLGPLVAIFSHFGQFPSDFRTQSKRLGPIRSLVLTCLATQNGPQSPPLVQYGNTPYHFVPRHFG